MDILHEVRADAERRLAGALKSRKSKKVGAALQEIVESSLPRPSMPHNRVKRAHPMASGPHRVWSWVDRTGMVYLIAEALPDWQTLTVTVRMTRPGISGRSDVVYRDETQHPEQLQLLVQAAIRQLQHRLG